MITLKEVEVMLAVCKAGSFIGAARELGITQGNVSKIVAGLEKKLATALFVRASDGVTLTNDGAYVQMYAEQIQILANKIKADAKVHAEETVDSDMKGKIA